MDDDQHCRWRDELKRRGNEIEEALRFLDGVKTIQRPHGSSYHLKHVAERYQGTYICNDAMIAALLTAGVQIQRIQNSRNCVYAISKARLRNRQMRK
ncbi:hypothetical protein [Bordetella petrii]|uniref:hypothetical protein n=1 Tax=Bordetella petrii TaxID=94624 RepID=UPI001A95BFBF|nr:hypothetical protein [Bordetella petrii]MBO1110679.1 hypothetical protein [Bordetella petrii]